MYEALKTLVLLPGSLLVALAIAVALLAFGRRRAGLAMTSVVLAVFYALSTPYVASLLCRIVQTVPPAADIERSRAQAIVVLGGGMWPHSPEYTGQSVDHITLQRLRYAAHLYRRVALPVLVTGGALEPLETPVAQAMRAALEDDLAVPVRWVEDKSRNTLENAIFSARMLRAEGIGRIILVTHASHMPRALDVFTATGLEVVAAPTAFAPPRQQGVTAFLPHLTGLQNSYYAIYEMLGSLAYRRIDRTALHAAP